MDKRHENNLLERIDQVIGRGWTFIFWWELYRWYDAPRLSKNVWRDISERLAELGVPAYVQETSEGVLIVKDNEFEDIGDKV